MAKTLTLQPEFQDVQVNTVGMGLRYSGAVYEISSISGIRTIFPQSNYWIPARARIFWYKVELVSTHCVVSSRIATADGLGSPPTMFSQDHVSHVFTGVISWGVPRQHARNLVVDVNCRGVPRLHFHSVWRDMTGGKPRAIVFQRAAEIGVHRREYNARDA